MAEAVAPPGEAIPTTAALSTHPGHATPSTADPVRERVRELADVASQFHVSLELEDLVPLLPNTGPADAGSLRDWIRAHPGVIEVDGRWVRGPTEAPRSPDPDRRARAEQYWQRALERFASPGAPGDRWLRFLGVTGSAAYRDAGPTDDCDLMAIVRPGTLWAYLAWTFLSLRLDRIRGERQGDPIWCLNYVLDERAVQREYSQARGFLFAREALTVRPVVGPGEYRQLLDRNGWLRQELPRLYASWGSGEGARQGPAHSPPGPGIRCLNGLLFPILATYLQVKGLWVNHQLRRAGQASHCFRTLTRPSRMALATMAFERRAAGRPRSATEDRQWSPTDGDYGGAATGPTPPPPSPQSLQR